MSILTSMLLNGKNCTVFRVLFLGICLIITVLLIALPIVDILDMFNSRQTSKFIYFTYAVLVVSAIYSLYLFFAKLQISFNIIDLLLAILLVFITLNRYYFQEIYGFSIRYYELLGLATLYMILRSAKPIHFSLFIIAIIVGGLIQVAQGELQLLGITQSNHKYFNITGGFQNPGPYGGYLISVFPAALGIVLFNKTAESKSINIYGLTPILYVLSIVTLIWILLVLPATQSRGAWIGAFTSSVYLLFFRYKEEIRAAINNFFISRTRKALATGLLLLMLGGAFLFLYSFKKGSSDGRLLIWKVTMNMIKNKPFQGEGFDRFEATYMNFQADYFRKHDNKEEAMLADDSKYAYNELLQFAAENGIPAASVLILLVMMLLFRIPSFRNKKKIEAIKNNESLKLIACAGIISILTFSVFSYPSQILPIKLNALIYLGILTNSQSTFLLSTQISPYSRKVPICLFLIYLTYKCIHHVGEVREAFYKIDFASRLYERSMYVDASKEFEKLYPFLNNYGAYLGLYGKALSMSERHKNAIVVINKAAEYHASTFIHSTLGDSYKILKNYQKAKHHYWTAHYMTPGKLYPLYLLAIVYLESGDVNRAKLIATTVLKTKAKVGSIAIDEMKSKMREILKK